MEKSSKSLALFVQSRLDEQKPSCTIKLNRTLLFLLPIICCASLSRAQTVTTDPVGFASATINPGYNAVGNAFTKPPIFQGAITTVSSSTVDISGTPTLEAGKSYYLEVVSVADTGGTALGERIDVASISGSTVTLDLTAAHNTIADTSTLLADNLVCIKEHFTLGDFIELLGTNPNGSPNFLASECDQILTFDGGFKTHILYSVDGNWYENFGDFNLANSKLVPPGAGIFFYRNPSPAQGTAESFDISFSGLVRTTSFVQVLKPGFQLVCLGFPLPESPGDLQYNTLLTGSSNFVASESDQILTWDSGFKTHLLYSVDSNWYQNFGDFDNVTATDLFNPAGSVIMKVQSGQVLEIPVPFSN